MSEERFDKLDLRLGVLDQRLDVVEHRLDGIDGRLEALGQRLEHKSDELRLHMGALHEEALSRIAAVGEGFPRLEALMNRGFAEMRETMDRRFNTLEVVVRQHSLEIERLKTGRG